MKDQVESRLPNDLMRAAPRALRRAADHARETARRTGTALVIVRNGVLMEIDPNDASLDAEDDESPGKS